MAPALVFVSMTCALLAWERLAALRPRVAGRRMLRNVGLFVPVGLPCVLAPVALQLPADGWLAATAPPWVQVTLTLVVLDLVHYLWHRAEHAVGVLWRLHRVHHSDRYLDVSTAVRFHPVETLLRALLSALVIAVLGPAPAAVLVYAAVSQALNLFNHANIALGRRVEQLLARVIITPALHRVHHSQRPAEQRANLGSILVCWDRLFATCLERDAGWQVQAPLGLRGCRTDSLAAMLLDPLR